MAVKSTSAGKASSDKPDVPEPTETEAPARKPGECVVDEPFHVGRAVNGLVCSYHAMRYRADGTPR